MYSYLIHTVRLVSIAQPSIAGLYILAVPEPQGETARPHTRAVISSGPYWSSVVPPPRRDPRHLPLVLVTVHDNRHLGGTTSVPQRSQTLPGSGDPTGPRRLLRRPPNGQGTPHSTKLPAGPGHWAPLNVNVAQYQSSWYWENNQCHLLWGMYLYKDRSYPRFDISYWTQTYPQLNAQNFGFGLEVRLTLDIFLIVPLSPTLQIL